MRRSKKSRPQQTKRAPQQMLAPYDWYRNTASPDYTLHVAWDDLAFAMRTNKLSEAPLHDLALDVRSNGLSEVAMLTLGDRPKGLVDEHFDDEAIRHMETSFARAAALNKTIRATNLKRSLRTQMVKRRSKKAKVVPQAPSAEGQVVVEEEIIRHGFAGQQMTIYY